jgi:UDP-glucose 4-epimerase
MQRHGVRRIVFSSSATVYAEPGPNIAETARLGALNPYGRTKLFIERILDDVAASDPEFAAISLRYFNPVGAHPSGLLGENPRGAPSNLFPWIAQVAAGERPALRVYGDDYATPDGSGVRDYIHVVDLARGHRAAIERLLRDGEMAGANTAINLGTGRGYSVFEAARAFAEAAGRPIPLEIAPRRPGDAAECTADPSLAARLLGWRAEYGLARMCADHWMFQQGLTASRRAA